MFIKTTLPAKICASAALRLCEKPNGITLRKILVMNIFLFSRKGAKALRIRTLIPSTGDQRYPYFVYRFTGLQVYGFTAVYFCP